MNAGTMNAHAMSRNFRAQVPDAIDTCLLFGFLIGIYLEIAVQLTASIPVPNIIAACTGIALLCRHPDWVEEKHVIALSVVILLFLVSIFCATDYGFLKKRFTGFLQLSYSLVLSYGFFITAIRYQRERLARLFLFFCIFILVGTTLENYTSFRAVSDFARSYLYDFGLYISDERDELLYGRVRPKLFTSEPSAVTFGFALYSMAWYLLSKWKWKLPAFLLMTAMGYFLMRGPTLLLGLVLVGPAEFMSGAPKADGKRQSQVTKLAAMGAVSVLLGGIAVWAATSLYATRLNDILTGSDPSFFYREIGPALAAFDIFHTHPIAGIGLTGEDSLGDRMLSIFLAFPGFSPDWPVESNAHVLNNYFWLHWVYLGIVWGIVMLIAISWYLRVLGTPSILLCWLVWAVFGQASGAYVSPKTWAVLMLACALSVLRERQPMVKARTAGLDRSGRPVSAGAYA